MKITLLSPLAPTHGGIARCGTFLAEELSASVPAFEAISLGPLYPSWLYPSESAPVSANYSAVWPQDWLRLRRKLIADSVDIALVPYWTLWHLPGMYALLRGAPFRSIGIFHNFTDHDGLPIPNFFRASFTNLFSAILCHSESVERDLRRAGYQGPIRRIWEPAPTGANPNRAKNEIPLILFSGYLRPYKGIDVLLAALDQCRHLRWRALIQGPPWRQEARKILRMIEELGLSDRVEFLPRWAEEAELNSWFQNSQVVVLPYRSATGSGVLARALAHRCPVIVTETGNLAEQVRSLKAGWVVPPNHPAALAGAIRQALSSERQLVAKGLAHSRFVTWQDYGQTIRELIELSTKDTSSQDFLRPWILQKKTAEFRLRT